MVIGLKGIVLRRGKIKKALKFFSIDLMLIQSLNSN
jgi:hypothetical protein